MKIKGRNAVREALRSDVNIIKIMASNSSDRVLQDILGLARKKGVKVQIVDNRALDKECDNHQGIVAITTEFEYSSVEDILNVARVKGTPNFILILDGGLGLVKVALLRFLKIHILKNTRTPLHDHVRKVKDWSNTQTVFRFVIIQIVVSIAVVYMVMISATK